MADEKRSPEKVLYWIYDESTQEKLDEWAELLKSYDLTTVPAEEFLQSTFAQESRILAHVSLDTLRRIMRKAEAEGWALTILPTDKQKPLAKAFGMQSDPDKALEILTTSEAKPLDLLYVNDEPVLYNALVGDVPPLSFRSTLLGDQPSKDKFKLFLHELGKLRHLAMAKLTLVTAKGVKIETAGTGLVIFRQGGVSYISNLLPEERYNDGQLRAAIVSPRSILSYIFYLFVAIFPYFRPRKLPESVGLIKTESLQIETDPRLQVIVDAEEYPPTPVRFTLHAKALKLCAPDAFWELNPPSQAEKETVRIGHLPQTDEAVASIRKRLPFFAHASEQEYRELFAALRQEAALQSTFVALIVFSTLLATVGLFLNSASVVIGAMLLAPLMQPIVAFAMGLLRWDAGLAFRALRTTLVGVLLVLLFSLLPTLLLPLRELTDEMAGRLHPTLLDLSVAVVSGMAAAYAKNNPRISGSLVGVAIAVALVPPLATAGIGLGWQDFSIFYHAFLLFLTNFVGIVLAAAVVFMVQGFSPIHRARKGLRLGLVAALLVALPLSLSFQQMTEDSQLLRSLQNRKIVLNKKIDVEIEKVNIRHEKGRIINCVLVVSRLLNPEEFKELKEKISHMVPGPFQIEIEQKMRM